MLHGVYSYCRLNESYISISISTSIYIYLPLYLYRYLDRYLYVWVAFKGQECVAILLVQEGPCDSNSQADEVNRSEA